LAELAYAANLVMALYNPISKPRLWQLSSALKIIRQQCTPEILW
jgi:precorrin-3B methylase